jgi:hypothetical protein
VLPKHEGPSELRHRTNPKNPVRAALLLQKKFCALCVHGGAWCSTLPRIGGPGEGEDHQM